MKDRTVTLLDLGMDPAFDTSTNLVRETLLNLTIDGRHFDVVTVRSRDVETVRAVLTSVGDVLHVMAHGYWSSESGPELYSESDDRLASMREIAESFLKGAAGIRASIVIVEACTTATKPWSDAIRDSISHPVTYVGSSRQIGWYDSAVFMPAFYGALGSRRGRGRTVAEQGLEAVAAARDAYERVSGRTCPFKAKALKPSRAALASIREFGE